MADPLEAMVAPVAEKIFNALLPQMKEIVARASEAAKPTIKQVIQEDVIPWAVVGLVAGAAVAALIGASMARR